jgi:tripartite-type tricarboxylate transporter receptor subunit TctC
MRHFAVLALIAALNATPVAAQDFYRGKTVTILAGFSPGGGFDLNARVLARHIGRHIPGNPTVVVQNMAGAGSLTAVHYLDLSAPKDGTVLDIFNFGNIGDSACILTRWAGSTSRKFNWIERDQPGPDGLQVWHSFGFRRSPNSRPSRSPYGPHRHGLVSDTNQRILSIFGVRIQQVVGYPGS